MEKPRNFLESIIKPLGLSIRSKEARQKQDDLEKIAAKEQMVFSYRVLAAATSNFSPSNKLGEGGFGPVYKGRLDDGREVAVKKLSMGSRQGMKEFVNEAKLLSKVQHRNVVNLYGYCAAAAGSSNGQHQEKLLVYEYVPHESLDKILFKKREVLDWERRFDIIVGVARGLLYLHEDAHDTIIHRDIKAGNILLDGQWSPKIADFGMARLYPEGQTHVNTGVAGTHGYMAPEYVMNGQLSTKADVFSFGVLVLELVSGQKNSTFIPQPDAESLLEWAWRLYKREKCWEMMDANLVPTASVDQVVMCVWIGLLCTQADQKLRPEMRRVVVMLSKKPSTLPQPTRPGFSISSHRRSHGSGSTGLTKDSSSRRTSSSSSNSVSASNSRISNTHTTSRTSDSNANTMSPSIPIRRPPYMTI